MHEWIYKGDEARERRGLIKQKQSDELRNGRAREVRLRLEED